MPGSAVFWGSSAGASSWFLPSVARPRTGQLAWSANRSPNKPRLRSGSVRNRHLGHLAGWLVHRCGRHRRFAIVFSGSPSLLPSEPASMPTHPGRRPWLPRGPPPTPPTTRRGRDPWGAVLPLCSPLSSPGVRNRGLLLPPVPPKAARRPPFLPDFPSPAAAPSLLRRQNPRDSHAAESGRTRAGLHSRPLTTRFPAPGDEGWPHDPGPPRLTGRESTQLERLSTLPPQRDPHRAGPKCEGPRPMPRSLDRNPTASLTWADILLLALVSRPAHANVAAWPR